MLDLKAIRREPEPVRAALARRRDGSDARLDDVLALDARRLELLPEVEALRARQNEASQGIAQAKKAGGDAAAAIAEMREVSRRVKRLGEELGGVEAELDTAMASLPNPPDPDAPDADTTLREVGTPGTPSHPPRDHIELAGGLIDMEAGAKVAGSRFAFLKGDMVLLELALVRWAIDLLGARGFTPAIPPVLVREEALFGTGFLPDTEQQIYRLADDALYLAGTAEVPLASLHAGEMLEESELPLRYAGFSPCFRREAGAAGRDTRGMFRVHQFDKVEMFTFVRPEDAAEEHERLLAIEEEILQALGVPYRVVNIAVDDLGGSAVKKYDCEGWLPGQQRYRELTSTSNTTDYQARRLDIRYRPAEGGRPRHTYTLNGTAVTWRHMIAMLENGQDSEGVVRLPEVLRPWGAPETLRVGGAR
ncbi:MAG: seryl-tRNA synthetase [Solirubrobacteraceae bacterium]|nr:seryl-tRNA synthetase [Solirubrobacteraceae bacterium]